MKHRKYDPCMLSNLLEAYEKTVMSPKGGVVNKRNLQFTKLICTISTKPSRPIPQTGYAGLHREMLIGTKTS
jgi:hypothetical protein